MEGALRAPSPRLVAYLGAMPRPWLAIAIVVLTGSLVGCGGKGSVHTSGSTVTSEPPSSTTTAPTGSTTTSTSEAPLSGGGTTPVSTPAAGRAQLTAVTADGHATFDRVVLQFEAGDVPGYLVQYTSRPVQEDPSGRDITVSGDSVLEVRLEHASGVDLSGGSPRPTYSGPHRIAGPGGAIVEVVEAGDFEGVLRWVAGTHGKPAFKVSTLLNPPRVIVDVAKP